MQVKHSYDKFKNKTISKGESKNFPVSKAWERDSISKRDIFRLKTWNFFFFLYFHSVFFYVVSPKLCCEIAQSKTTASK